MEHIRILCN